MNRRKSGKGVDKHPSLIKLQEGEKLQQQGGMRKGQEAVNLLKTAVEKYNESLQLQLPDDRKSDVYTFLGECYQAWAEKILEICYNLSSEELTLEKQKEAKYSACELFQKSVECYKIAGNREDAMIGCGNALAAWGENTEDPIQAEELYTQALSMYKNIQGMEEDVDSLSNYADVCMQKGSLLCENNRIEEGQQCYKEGVQVYMSACSLCDSTKGDDLPGLLSNWGNALVDMADNVQDAEQSIPIYDEAIQRLQSCIEFARGDVDPYISLGNAFFSKAKKLNDADLYKDAIKQGFEGALKVNNNTVEAMVGIAEVLFELYKISQNDQAKKLYLEQSLERYQQVLTNIDKVQGFEQRCDIQYNYACVLTAAQMFKEACSIIIRLVHIKGADTQEIVVDQDLRPLHQLEEFQTFFQQQIQ